KGSHHLHPKKATSPRDCLLLYCSIALFSHCCVGFPHCVGGAVAQNVSATGTAAVASVRMAATSLSLVEGMTTPLPSRLARCARAAPATAPVELRSKGAGDIGRVLINRA